MRKSKPAKATLIEIGFLEAMLRRLPDALGVIRPLADLYTAVGRTEEGYRLDLRITDQCPDDGGAWYNLACSQALLDMPDESIRSLQRAVRQGYDDVVWMSKDPDLESVRDLPEFMAILQSLRTA